MMGHTFHSYVLFTCLKYSSMKDKDTNSRRDFLKTGVALGNASLIASPLLTATEMNEKSRFFIKENYTLLFQGDSITDGNRTRNNDWNHLMGHGYVYIIAGKLWYQYPDAKLRIYNRGVSGNKVTDLEQRWQEDTIALKPDLLSILIGINDVAAFISGDTHFTPEQYEDKYRGLLTATKTQFPDVQFVLCEPFVLPVGQVKEKFEMYTTEVEKRQAAVRKLAAEFNAVYIPFQDVFNKALQRAPADYWIWDGIHPMPAGHEAMALEWMKLVGKKLKIKMI